MRREAKPAHGAGTAGGSSPSAYHLCPAPASPLGAGDPPFGAARRFVQSPPPHSPAGNAHGAAILVEPRAARRAWGGVRSPYRLLADDQQAAAPIPRRRPDPTLQRRSVRSLSDFRSRPRHERRPADRLPNAAQLGDPRSAVFERRARRVNAESDAACGRPLHAPSCAAGPDAAPRGANDAAVLSGIGNSRVSSNREGEAPAEPALKCVLGSAGASPSRRGPYG